MIFSTPSFLNYNKLTNHIDLVMHMYVQISYTMVTFPCVVIEILRVFFKPLPLHVALHVFAKEFMCLLSSFLWDLLV